jgi:hypothetical protein
MGDGVEATLHSSNISKNIERYFFTEDMLRKSVIFDRILFNELGRIQKERQILESRIRTILAILRRSVCSQARWRKDPSTNISWFFPKSDVEVLQGLARSAWHPSHPAELFASRSSHPEWKAFFQKVNKAFIYQFRSQ